jgi:predicted enzyme related to lactoylglutathione lyase
MSVKVEKRIYELGGVTIVPKTDLGKHSCYVKINNPEGNELGFILEELINWRSIWRIVD